ncbi:hypothetical protein ASPFODRAFT_597176 [Aspergillus luchuensis CBS 106.47]|uniref:Uncharacterized protein n=1 Tax=Aspergillus luchuensis (strain CBS 106.47) TaxID=1137211 RepID=A0A1M3THU3_ASPLC|nr:hypothetical protein ASPFODRAFT_597176 [Aspergillus luchuensis CBS 106.47]
MFITRDCVEWYLSHRPVHSCLRSHFSTVHYLHFLFGARDVSIPREYVNPDVQRNAVRLSFHDMGPYSTLIIHSFESSSSLSSSSSASSSHPLSKLRWLLYPFITFFFLSSHSLSSCLILLLL